MFVSYNHPVTTTPGGSLRAVLPVPRPEPPEAVRPTPATRVAAATRAARSPSALILGAAGAGVCVLASAPLVVTVFVAAFLYLCRVAFAALAVTVPRPEPILAYSVAEPWRGFVLSAQSLGQRFAAVANQSQAGPLHDQLVIVANRIDDGVRRAWEVARKGDALDQSLAALNVPAIQKQAEETSNPATLAAINAQLATATRLQQVSSASADRLRLLNAQLGEAVAQAVELSLTEPSDAAISRLSGNVDSAVHELEALRQGMEEVAPPEV